MLNHWDGFDNNYYLARHTDGRFRIYPWDLDRIYEDGEQILRGYLGKNKLTEKLLKDPEYEAFYLATLSLALEQYSAESLLSQVDSLGETISEAYGQDLILTNRAPMAENHSHLKSNIETWLSFLNQQIGNN